MVKCENCKFYPDNCGYWNREYRLKKLKVDTQNATFLKADIEHNCPDYKKGV